MQHLNSLLLKFKSIVNNQGFVKEKTAEVISSFLRKEIKTETVSFKNGVITLRLEPIAKTEIFLNKEKVIADIKQKTGVDVIEIC